MCVELMVLGRFAERRDAALPRKRHAVHHALTGECYRRKCKCLPTEYGVQ